MVEAITKENEKMCAEIKKNTNVDARVSYANAAKSAKSKKKSCQS